MAKEYYKQLCFTMDGVIKAEPTSRPMTKEEIQEYDEMVEDLDQISIFDWLDMTSET